MPLILQDSQQLGLVNVLVICLLDFVQLLQISLSHFVVKKLL